MVNESTISARNLIVVYWTMFTVNCTVFILRAIFLYRRRKEGRNRLVRWADITLLMGLIFSAADISLATWTAEKWDQYARHPSKEVIPAFGVPLKTAITQQKISIGIVIIYYSVVWWIKVTFCLIYAESRAHVSKFLKRYLDITFGIIMLLWAANIVFVLSDCGRIERSWAVGSKDFCAATTNGKPAITFGFATILGTDLLLLAYPILMMRNLQLKSRQRTAIWVLVVIGLASIVCGTLRYAFLQNANKDPSPEEIKNTWLTSLLFGGIEISVGFFDACLPALRSLLVARTTPTSSKSTWETISRNIRHGFRRKSDTQALDTGIDSFNDSQTELREVTKAVVRGEHMA